MNSYLTCLFAGGIFMFSCQENVDYDIIDHPQDLSFIQEIRYKEFQHNGDTSSLQKGKPLISTTEIYADSIRMKEYLCDFGYVDDINIGPLDVHKHYQTVTEDNKITYYIDGEASLFEIRKDNWMYLYTVSYPIEPFLVRELDDKKNILKEWFVDDYFVYEKQFSPVTFNSNGLVESTTIQQLIYKRTDTKPIEDFNTINYPLDRKEFSIAEFDYVMGPLN